jgi:hypothetical protein
MSSITSHNRIWWWTLSPLSWIERSAAHPYRFATSKSKKKEGRPNVPSVWFSLSLFNLQKKSLRDKRSILKYRRFDAVNNISPIPSDFLFNIGLHIRSVAHQIRNNSRHTVCIRVFILIKIFYGPGPSQEL